MKTTLEHKKRVGIFVTIGIVLICVTLFFIGGREVFRSQYELKVEFPQIQGLTEGSVVSLSGIKIGNIRHIGLIPGKNAVEVILQIDSAFTEKITQGSVVDIRTQGALGDKYLFITPGPVDAPPMAEGSMIPAAPENDLLSVLNNKGDRATTLFDILDDLHQITQSLLAENRMAKIPMQTEAALKQLNQTLSEATLTLRDLRGQASNSAESKLSGVVTKLDRILGKIERGEGSLGALINDSSVHDRLKNLLGTQDAAHQTRSLLRTSIKHQEDRSQ